MQKSWIRLNNRADDNITFDVRILLANAADFIVSSGRNIHRQTLQDIGISEKNLQEINFVIFTFEARNCYHLKLSQRDTLSFLQSVCWPQGQSSGHHDPWKRIRTPGMINRGWHLICAQYNTSKFPKYNNYTIWTFCRRLPCLYDDVGPPRASWLVESEADAIPVVRKHAPLFEDPTPT